MFVSREEVEQAEENKQRTKRALTDWSKANSDRLFNSMRFSQRPFRNLSLFLCEVEQICVALHYWRLMKEERPTSARAIHGNAAIFSVSPHLLVVDGLHYMIFSFDPNMGT